MKVGSTQDAVTSRCVAATGRPAALTFRNGEERVYAGRSASVTAVVTGVSDSWPSR